MKDAYGNAGANAWFRRHHLLSLPALKDLASASSPPLYSAEGKTEKTQALIMTVYTVALYKLGIPERKESEMSKSWLGSILDQKNQGDFLLTGTSHPAHTWMATWRKLLSLLECKAMQ